MTAGNRKPASFNNLTNPSPSTGAEPLFVGYIEGTMGVLGCVYIHANQLPNIAARRHLPAASDQIPKPEVMDASFVMFCFLRSCVRACSVSGCCLMDERINGWMDRWIGGHTRFDGRRWVLGPALAQGDWWLVR